MMCRFGSIEWSHYSRSLLLFNINDDTSFFFFVLFVSIGFMWWETDVDDNKSGDQQNDNEVIKDMKYDFFSPLFLSYAFFVFSLSFFFYLLFWQFMNSEEALSVTSRNGDSFNSSLSFVNKANCVCVHDRIFFLSFSFSYFPLLRSTSTCMNVRLCLLTRDTCFY